MYRTCLACSADLGVNEAIEPFPVGRSLAFDAWKGRLWALCPTCGRWNLAPIEERWEAVEEAERKFREARLRVQRENVGLARLPDGTRLIRVGDALPGELAAWRYGDQLVRRRRRYLLVGGAVAVAGTAYVGLALAGVLGGAAGLINVGNMAWQRRRGRRVVHRVPAELSHTGRELVLRRYHLNGARVTSASGEIALYLPYGLDAERTEDESGRSVWVPVRALVLEGSQARAVLSRAMVAANRKGASRAVLREALGRLESAGGADQYLRDVSRFERSLGIRYGGRPSGGLGFRQLIGTFRGERIPSGLWGPEQTDDHRNRLPPPQALALEMALHEESERRALEGELAELERAWREAEEIAAIADALPDDPLDRLLPR